MPGGLPVPSGTGNSDTITEQEWDRVVNLNLKGPFLVTMAVLKHMKQLAKGKIIFVSSMGAVNPAVSVLHYHSAKAGILGFAKNLAFELAPRNIHVNTIVPGPIGNHFLGLPDAARRRPGCIFQGPGQKRGAHGTDGTGGRYRRSGPVPGIRPVGLCDRSNHLRRRRAAPAFPRRHFRR